MMAYGLILGGCDDPNLPTRLVQKLLAKGAGASITDTRERTALHSAVGNCVLGVIKALVTTRADVSAADTYGKTPLHCLASGSSANSDFLTFRLVPLLSLH